MLGIERMYAYCGDRNDKGQYLYYGKTGGCVVTGNEDGVKACSMDILYAMSHIGYTIPPQADCGWIGEAGPGPSYSDVIEAGHAGGLRQRVHPQELHDHVVEPDAHRPDTQVPGRLPARRQHRQDWNKVSNAADQDPNVLTFTD